ncbi:similar to Saccharomyces cerevisiae YHL004W MRP4 Mitochondrial ribosomal protein of the small subunit [Maudiozyma barnettii]|uniref:Similar to Saccharomyces cerevisiae YHL004W MRP4 Mitochondrial ribosomal protein of the small subunit n=1 Tax=Maudiozyma barnettii TaxID=61262 RepID=A0A8H2VK25_9SACH|nr:mitochondrial 37S ribosomal protein MRP4 [Kazachstania barnettii]CAB4256866.1 similar to Saccharomyces cerevisiae YHL004W MRP4 Mitochondrial ribosomal protein of the small subunit [Kazachstania barnettii]CAD1785285.1 similar to Saccharomyces cerevisiae YHL004W MRP4 Mitochondrial ribosomal protein of the small subunit [Kazachstania barnettii]
MLSSVRCGLAMRRTSILHNARGHVVRRFQHTNETLDAEVDQDLLLVRQKQMNDSISARLKSLREVSVDELDELQKVLDKPLTAKEKQLDEELTSFLNEFSSASSLGSSPSVLSTGNNENASIGGQLEQFPFLEPSSNDKPYTPQELFLRQLKHAKQSARLGADVTKVYNPNKDLSKPLSIDQVSITKLMEAGVHLGQSTSLWRSSTQPFIYGEYKGIHIIDMNKTLSYLKRASEVMEGIVERGGIILFLGTREGQKRPLEEAAKRVNGYYVSTRWIPGTLTNPTEISGVWEKLEVDMAEKSTGRLLSADENASIVKPDLLVVLNPTENRNALNEAMKTRVPTIGIIDTDSEPSLVTYPIPGNDDSYRSISLILGVLAKAGERGLKTRLNKFKTAEL